MKTFLIFAFTFVSMVSFFLGHYFGVEDTMNAHKTTLEEKKLVGQCFRQNAELMGMIIDLKYGKNQ